MQRRAFLARSALWISTSFLGSHAYLNLLQDKLKTSALLGKIMPSLSQKSLTSFAQLLLLFPKDKIDVCEKYVEDSTFSGWHSIIHPFFREQLLTYGVPAEGRILEFGVYRGQTRNVLIDIFGPDRYVGIDKVNYTEHEDIIIVDVRDWDFHEPIAFAFNDLSTWKGSPRSRMAASQIIRKNLIPGGLYMEEGLKNLPKDFDMSGLEIVHKAPYFTLFRRIS